jgi:hypothetical protein
MVEGFPPVALPGTRVALPRAAALGCLSPCRGLRPPWRCATGLPWRRGAIHAALPCRMGSNAFCTPCMAFKPLLSDCIRAPWTDFNGCGGCLIRRLQLAEHPARQGRPGYRGRISPALPVPPFDCGAQANSGTRLSRRRGRYGGEKLNCLLPLLCLIWRQHGVGFEGP